jgi:hypothetical protein
MSARQNDAPDSRLRASGRHAVHAERAHPCAREQRGARSAAAAQVEHAAAGEAGGRKFVGSAVARQVDTEQRKVVVKALSGEEGLGHASMTRTSCSASRVSSRAKQQPNRGAQADDPERQHEAHREHALGSANSANRETNAIWLVPSPATAIGARQSARRS